MANRTETPALAVILAREGSKRLPGKNLKSLGGKPLIVRAIEAAHASGCFGQVLVSTDSGKIARVAREHGAWVPFIRPTELASDTASSVDALYHAVEYAVSPVASAALPRKPEMIVLVQTTSPFVSPAHLREAIDQFENLRLVSLSSMRRVREHPGWMFRCDDLKRAQPLDLKLINVPSRSLEPLYLENGAIYVVRTEYFLKTRSLYQFETHGCYLMGAEDSIDIDEPEDWDEAVRVLKRRNPLT